MCHAYFIAPFYSDAIHPSITLICEWRVQEGKPYITLHLIPKMFHSKKWYIVRQASSGSYPVSSKHFGLLSIQRSRGLEVPSIFKAEPSHPTEEANFYCFYPGSCSFGHDPYLMIISEVRNMDGLVNRDLCLLVNLPCALVSDIPSLQQIMIQCNWLPKEVV